MASSPASSPPIELHPFPRATATPSRPSVPMREKDYDYTEGASTSDIEHAITEARSIHRRDSQVGFSYEAHSVGSLGVGSVFDGPGNVAIPSSSSRMRGMSQERSQHLRRMSVDSVLDDGVHSGQRWRRSEELVRPSASRIQSYDSAISARSVNLESEDEGEHDTVRRRRSTRQRSPTSEDHAGHSMFESFTNIFSGRRTSISGDDGNSRRPSLSIRSGRSSRRSQKARRSSSTGSTDAGDINDERWGYSSGEEDNSSSDELIDSKKASNETGHLSDMDFGSLPPSPTGSLPNLALAPVFGDTRIDMNFTLEPTDPPPPGDPSRQAVYMPDEDTTIRFIGYEVRTARKWLWRLGCVITLGILGLLGHWFPRLWLRWVAREKAFKDSKDGFVAVEVCVSCYDVTLTNDSSLQTPYRDTYFFPIQSLPYPYALSTVFPVETDANILNGKSNDVLQTLKVVDYRYLRFALDPRTGLFTPLR